MGFVYLPNQTVSLGMGWGEIHKARWQFKGALASGGQSVLFCRVAS